MIEAATGLVLRTRPLTETSLIVNWLTAELGRISTVAKGARRSKSIFRGKLDLFYLADFTFSRSRRSELHTLREISLRETHSFLRRELALLHQASYAAALIEQVTELDTPVPAIFDLLRQFLGSLPLGPTEPRTIFAFELKLLQELGLAPDLSQANLRAGATEVARALLQGEWSAIHRLRLSEAQATELRQFLHGFIIFHLGKIPRSRAGAIK
jgi:DNA repair protein RecO (recombination protein O)